MSLFNYGIYLTANTNITSSTNETNRLNIEVTPANQISETIASLSVCDYLGGFGIMLIFVAIIRIISEFKPRSQIQKHKSQRELNIEFLERIWIINTSKIKD